MNDLKFVNIEESEFKKSEPIYRIITHENANTFGYFIVNGRNYYLSSFSFGIVQPDIEMWLDVGYIFVGIDLKVVVLDANSGGILLSLGLSSYFKGFKNIDSLTFCIFSDLADIIINKNGLSISQIIYHDLEI